MPLWRPAASIFASLFLAVMEVGMFALQNPDAGLEHECREVAGIFTRQWPAHVLQAIPEPVDGFF
jgi:hypothetical protein